MARISVPRDVPKPQGYASDGTDAVGFVHFWGVSPALDLLGADPQAAAFGPAAVGLSPGGGFSSSKGKDADNSAEGAEAEDAGGSYEDGAVEDGGGGDASERDPQPASLPTEDDATVNLLLVGAADTRHVLKTLAKRRRSAGGRGAPGKVRIYIHEKQHEVLARHLLFLQIVNNTALPVRERMELFLSLHGNALVRERDSDYVGNIAAELVELVTDNSTHPIAGAINLSHLKYKDRDILQDVFRGWFKGVDFDIEALREQRCRGFYRERYDYRKNLMDMNYTTYIRNSAGIISWFHYKEFCHTGVAFESRLASYNFPNRTLASYTEAVERKSGSLVQARGFWGDILNSPYHAFGTATDPQDRARLFVSSSQQYRHSECDIAEFNVTAFIHEMETGQAFHLPPERPEEHVFPYASPLEELQQKSCKVEEVQEDAAAEKSEPKAGGRRAKGRAGVEWPALASGFEGVEIVLLSGDLKETLRKSKYRGLFHRAYVGSMAVLPLFEETGLTKEDEDPFRNVAAGKVRTAPRLEAKELFGTRREQSALACVMADGGEVVFETMKYYTHFEGSQRLGFRHRVAQAGHLVGWRLRDERHALPRLEQDMPERRARDIEKDATDFLRFVTTAAEPAGNA